MFLEIRDLSIDLGEFKLVDVSLGVEKREYVTIIGPTGSGKSILLETIAGFYKPERGKIILEGRDITHLPPEKRGVSVVYQDYVLFPHMTVYDNIAYGLRKKINDEERIKEEVERIAKVLKIDHLLHRMPTTLSGGEMQRAAIARALVVKPKLLLMDEPFSALDVKTREKLRRLVKKAIQEYQTTVLHVTHDFDDIFSLATKVVVMRDGKVLQIGEPEEVFSRPSSDFVADFVGTNILKCRVVGAEGNLTVLSVNGLRIYSTDRAEIGEEVRVSIRPENIIIAKEPIESSARNVFIGKVSEVSRKGHLVWLRIKLDGVELKAVITPNSCDLLGIEEGKEFYVIFKASNVRIVG
ncbi:ATP-binding cassette domain-containing protein [Thermococcus sp. M39]|uniref:ATP-binding cassette domain-containing protein n=1 Tax=unclassified Thermococcus TaxID=2627626 RepID=UPI00143944B2|nr:MULTISPECIES: ATP-binding cassette domain-containing protein [unclassified Thermococcus]NJE07076.1 ATP-binding cassette domain-containing protein [Thermococcus sp. M39]NJE13614.1 ATP-binding cassette domain-containing protein [Thermococcus sp. LS2]